MTHPDDTEEAQSWMVDKAMELKDAGVPHFRAVEQAVSLWEKSLLRMQLINKWQKDLLNRGKPTLHVPLFEAAMSNVDTRKTRR